jgi:hypothetical protein
MRGIFISYRREDARGDAGRLANDLQEIFGAQQIFRDIEAIEAGTDFVRAIDEGVGACAVLLAVIGSRWLSVTGADGQRRIDDPRDYVRLEIALALKRDVRVVPVLVGEARMPKPEELPEDIAALARRHAHELSDRRWQFDVSNLAKVIEKAGVMPLASRTGTETSLEAKMDPLSVLLMALVAGAAAGLEPAAKKAVQDAYEGLKTLIKRKWGHVPIESLERDPKSPERQKIVKEDLEAARAANDTEVLAQAQNLIRAVKDQAPEAAQRAGIRLADLEAAGSVRLEDLLASGDIQVEKVRAGGDLDIRGVRAGNPRDR